MRSSGPGTTILISQSGGVQGDGDSELPAVSADGRYIAFQSAASNLVVPDSNLKEDIFVADRTTGALSLASQSTSGVRGDGHSLGAAISADGRYVAFASFARNLADGITTPVGKSQIYRRDRTSGTTTLVSAGLAGTGGNGSSGVGIRVAISADGQFVAYDSIATDLVTPDANGSASDIFVWTAGSSTTALVSVSTAGVQGNLDSYSPSLSGDGRYVAFQSFATNLGATNGLGQIYVRDQTAATTTKVSVSTGGTEGNAESKNAAVSADGRFIAFESTSTNLTADPKFFATLNDVYARDQISGTTVRVSLDASGLPVNGDSKDAAVSTNGTRISFTSNASFGPPNPSDEIYVRNQTTGEVVQVSVSSAGATGNGFSENSSVSGDGLVTAFRSLATNLVSPPTSGRQIFVNVQTAGPAADFGEGFPFTFGVCGFCVFSRDPVNLATGSLTSHADDLVLPGRVLPFAFTRWYNSADATAGPLGPGWTHNYNWKLTDSGGTVEIRRGDGRRDTFTRNPDGTYADPPNVFDALVKNGDGTFTLTLTSQTQYEFTVAGQLTQLHEPASNQLTLTYTGANLTGITDTVGRQITLTYDGANRLTQLQDPLGRKVTYAYDANGRLSTVTDKIGNAPGQNPALHRWTYGYDGATRHITTITDPDGRVRVTNTYDSQGRVFQQRDALNALTQISYSAGQTVVTDPRLHPTTYTFDSRMRVLTQVDTVGSNTYTITFVYDAQGNRTSVTDRNGKTTDFTYDTRGNVLTKTDPEIDPQTPRYLTQFGYDTKNNLRLVTDARSFVTTLTYDPTSNLLLSVSRQIDATTSATTKYEYTDATNPGLPTKVIAPRGNSGPNPNYAFATTLTYDAQGNLTRRIDPDGAKTTFAYDGAGRLTSFVDPDGYAPGANPAEHTWLVGYDENDRETSRTDPLGNVLGYGYDGAGDRTTLTDRRGNITTYTYDPNTRLATVQQKPDPVGQPTLVYTTAVTTRDGNGNATRITQANGVVTDYAFDALDRLTSVSTHPDAQTTLTTSYVLDGNGQPTSRTTGDGVTVNYTYDALSRLSTVSGPALSITYAYDPTSQRTQMVDATGTTTYQYDGLGRVSQVAAPNGTLTYVYDLDGNRTTLGYPGSQNVTYAYSPGGRLNTVTDWASRLSTYTYKASGLVSTLSYPNTMLASYTYDRAQRLTQLTNTVGATTVTQHTYTLDAEGNRTALDEYVQGITPPVPTWSASVQVNDVATGQQDRPDIALGADGATYLIWDDMRSGTDVFFSRRDPATGAWSANQKVDDDSTNIQWNPAIALDASNNAYAVWSDRRTGTIKNPDTDIFFSKRSAATGVWSANVQVNDDTNGRAVQGTAEIAVRSTGDAVAVWEDHRSNQWNVYSARLAAGGSTWGTNLRVTDNTSSRKFTPDVAVGADGTAYAVWEDDRSGNSDIYFSTLPVGSSTWTANVKISDDPGTFAQYDPQLGISAAGDLLVIWQDDRVPNTEVRMRRRLAGQSNWQASVVASDAAAIPVSLALGVRSDGNAFAAWQDARGASYDIWGADYTFGTNSWSASTLVSDDPASTAQMRPAAALSTNELALAWRDDRVTGGDIRARRRAATQGVDHFAYAYDGLNRLLSATGPIAESFALDAASNITARTGPGATYTYDGANRTLSDGTQAFVWSGADRLAQRGADTFSYDALGRLTSSAVGGTARGYSYDGDGLLTSRTQSAPTTFLWDTSRTTGNLLLSGSDRIVHGIGPLYGVHVDSTTFALAVDGLGSVRAELGDGGALLKSFRYSAYGTVRQSLGGNPAVLGYASELGDPSGLIYLRARWYDPAIGRFLTRDPVPGEVAAPSSLNMYGYVLGNPINFTDPSGRLCPPCAAALIAVVANPLVRGAAIGGLSYVGGLMLANRLEGRPAFDRVSGTDLLVSMALGAVSGGAGTIPYASRTWGARLAMGGGLGYAGGIMATIASGRYSPSEIVLTSIFGGIGNAIPVPGGSSVAGFVIGAAGGGLVQAGQTLLQDFLDRFARQLEQSPMPGTHVMVAGSQGK